MRGTIPAWNNEAQGLGTLRAYPLWAVLCPEKLVTKTSLGLPNLKMKGKNDMNSSLSSKKTLSCKWPIPQVPQ